MRSARQARKPPMLDPLRATAAAPPPPRLPLGRRSGVAFCFALVVVAALATADWRFGEPSPVVIRAPAQPIKIAPADAAAAKARAADIARKAAIFLGAQQASATLAQAR